MRLGRYALPTAAPPPRLSYDDALDAEIWQPMPDADAPFVRHPDNPRRRLLANNPRKRVALHETPIAQRLEVFRQGHRTDALPPADPSPSFGETLEMLTLPVQDPELAPRSDNPNHPSALRQLLDAFRQRLSGHRAP